MRSLKACIVLIAVILALWALSVLWKFPQQQISPLKAQIEMEGNRPNKNSIELIKLDHDARKLENEVRTSVIQGISGAV